ncbi:MAG: hypothetical protein WA970_22285, partial [Gammaproteobacteria bacterium]
HWRQQRANRHERIPTPLWDQAVALTQVLPNGRVAKALGLSATDLKQRCLAQPTILGVPVPGADPCFVELTPEAGVWPVASGTQVELERPDGVRMCIRYAPGSANLGDVVRAFVEGGRCFN